MNVNNVFLNFVEDIEEHEDAEEEKSEDDDCFKVSKDREESADEHIFDFSEDEEENEDGDFFEDVEDDENGPKGIEITSDECIDVRVLKTSTNDDASDDEEKYYRPHLGKEFDSQEEAYDFYNRYAAFKGFSIRRSSTYKSRMKAGQVIGRTFCCSLEGHRNSRENNFKNKIVERPETRTGCKALMTIRMRNNRWIVTTFNEDHNHVFSTPSKVHKLRSHRKVKQGPENLPSHYIPKRWRKDAKSGPVIDAHGKSLQAKREDPVTLRYAKLCREAINFATRGAVTSEVYNIAIQSLHKALQEVEDAIKKIQVQREDSNEEIEVNKKQASSGVKRPLLDPHIVRQKEAQKKQPKLQRSQRFKAYFEKRKKKNATLKILVNHPSIFYANGDICPMSKDHPQVGQFFNVVQQVPKNQVHQANQEQPQLGLSSNMVHRFPVVNNQHHLLKNQLQLGQSSNMVRLFSHYQKPTTSAYQGGMVDRSAYQPKPVSNSTSLVSQGVWFEMGVGTKCQSFEKFNTDLNEAV